MNARTKTMIHYFALLLIGLCCPVISRLSHFSWPAGIALFVWVFVFLDLSCRFRTKKERLITGVVFTASYCVAFAGVLGNTWISFLLIAVFGLVLHAAFILAGAVTVRWNRFPVTLVFPLIWLCLYLLATVLRFPALLRPDMMLAEFTTLLQAEHLIGSTGLSFAVLWLVSVLRFAQANRKPWCAGVGGGLLVLLLLPGIITLYTDTQASETVRAAYATGPYIGDFLNYTNASYDVNVESLTRSVSGAAEQNADILVFTEEAFALDSADEDRFLTLCSDLAAENDLAMLVGLDIGNADSSGGRTSANKAVLIDSSGEIVGTYQKSRLIPIIESAYAPGDGTIPCCTLDLHGKSVKVACLICYDSNFPGYARKIDPDTDLLLLPSWDWPSITQMHANLCRALAAENQVYILKPTYDGLSAAISPAGEILSCTSTDTAGFETVQITEIPIRSTCTAAERTVTLSPLLWASVGTEIMSAMICLLLLIANRINKPKKLKRARWFKALVSTTLTGCCADAVSWVLDGASRLNTILYLTTLVSMLETLIIIGIFGSYLTEYIKEKKHISHFPEIINWIFIGTAAAFTLIAAFSGKLFTFENGSFTEGTLYSVYVLVNAFSILVGLAVVFLYRRSLDRMDRTVAYIYMLAPVTMAVINLWIEDWSFAYPAITISLVLIYVMLQMDQMQRLEQQGQIDNYRATHDELTGLLNRRALNEKIEELKDTDGSCGIIFSDVNGLKYTNDRFGHEAGDRLLQRYATILSGIFRTGDLYRIGGDEYICLIADVSEASFMKRIGELIDRLRQDDPPVACIGAVYGANRDIDSLRNRAETLMYADKQAVHEQHPELKR